MPAYSYFAALVAAATLIDARPFRPHSPPHGQFHGPPHGQFRGPPHGQFHGPPHGWPHGPPSDLPEGRPDGAQDEAPDWQTEAHTMTAAEVSSTPSEVSSAVEFGYTSASVWPKSSVIAKGSGSPSGTGHPIATGTGSPSSQSNTTITPNPDTIRGVNIGGWLVLEKWMTPEVFEGCDAVDQWSFDSQEGAIDKIYKHWENYFCEDDVKNIASWGINALRIPIGYWAYDNTGSPYITGADAYLEKAIGWARNAGLKVLVDLHGVPGGQNGFDNSGHADTVEWQTGDNMDRTIAVLETITKKYGCEEYADAVIGIELVNEPISWEPNNFDVTQAWTKKAYNAVRAVATNPDLQIVMHDSFATPFAWMELASGINGDADIDSAPFAIDTHLYQNQVGEDSQLNQDEHVAKACNWSTSALPPSDSSLPVYVGEWSAQTNICANPDGSTVAGNECWTEGCQCSTNVDVSEWQAPLIEATRRFVEAQMDVFEQNGKGWYIWSYKGPGVWGFESVMNYLYEEGETIKDRKYPGQCGFSGDAPDAYERR